MKALIDTEIYLFRAAAACEFEIEWAPDEWTYVCRHGDAQALFQDSIAEIMEALQGLQPVLVFSAGVSFRYGVWPTYKANRKRNRKPAGYGRLREWVAKAAAARGWEVVELPDIEGDDVLGVLYEQGDVIVSTDKDLLTIPGYHLRNGEIIEVSRAEADRNFYTQVLVGDTSDNYPGCPTFGPKTAEKLLAGWEKEVDLWREVVNAYVLKGPFPDRPRAERYAITQARCARILRAGEYDLDTHTVRLWNPPVG
jgi:DNA polymerase-1